MFTVRYDAPNNQQTSMIEAHCVETFPIEGGGIRVVASLPDGSVSNYGPDPELAADTPAHKRGRVWVMNSAGETVGKYLL